jgi:hypothetical protein
MREDEARIRAIEEEALMLAEFVQAQAQRTDELARHVEGVLAFARQTRENSRRIQAEIAARRLRFGRIVLRHR